VVSANRSRLGALVLGALLCSACDRGDPSSEASGSAASSKSSDAQRVASAPPAAVFNVGEIKTAAEYSKDPEFAAADLKRGELLSFACAACHTFGAAGQQTMIGPNRHGVFGRPAAALADFEYSPALRASSLVWTPRAIEAWLADPSSFVVGTTMTFTGYRAPADRRDLIAYLLQATQ
jgi:cytochrome c